MQFTYRAKQDRRTEASGVVEAVDLGAAVPHLKRMGLFPLEVVPLETPEVSPARSVDLDRPLSRSALALWARTVGQGLSAGLSLTQALHLLAEQEKGRPAGAAARRLETQVTAGMSLADAMEQRGAIFSPVAVSLARAGEAGGALEEVLRALAEQVEAEAELISKVRGALVYPLFVLTVGIGTVAVLVWGVVPKLSILFAETGQPIPWATRFLVGGGKWLVGAIGIGFSGVLSAFWIFRRQGKQFPVTQWGIRLLRRLPGFGRLIEQAQIARLSATMNLLLDHGLALPEALRLGAATVGDPALKGQIQMARQQVIEGVSLSASFRRARIEEPYLLTMLVMGEAQGDLARAFGQAGERFRQEVDRAIRVLSSLIEPLMILLVGLIVGGIVFSMLLPIFQINFSIG